MTGWEIAAVLVAGIAAALAKSIAGLGYPTLLIPIVALFLETAEAVIVVSISNFVQNVLLIWNARRERKGLSGFPLFLAVAVAGAVIGAWLLPLIQDRILRMILLVLVVAFIITRLRAPGLGISPRLTRWLSPFVGLLAGLSQGAMGISGVIVSPWFLSLRLPRNTYVFAITVVFALTGAAQILVFASRGAYTMERLSMALPLIPIVVIVQPAGVALRGRLSGRAFEYVVLAVLAVSAISLAAKLW